jgi:uncharacterized membrane protein YdjX (TVP38/TMEM64 family)
MTEPWPKRAATLLRVAILAVLLAALVYYRQTLGGGLAAFTAWVQTLGAWGPAVFIAGYAAATVAFVPGSVLTLAGGAIFGLARGTAYVFVGASIGACAAFGLARSFARAAIERRIAGNPRFAAVDRAVAAEGRKIVFLLRLSPVFPFTLLNYALGLTRVRFVDYAIACMGMLPGVVLYVYLGSLAGDVSAQSAAAGGGAVLAFKLAGFAFAVIATVLIARSARRALAQAALESAP